MGLLGVEVGRLSGLVLLGVLLQLAEVQSHDLVEEIAVEFERLLLLGLGAGLLALYRHSLELTLAILADERFSHHFKVPFKLL